MGYTRVRHYAGGLQEWRESGGAVAGRDAGAPEAELEAGRIRAAAARSDRGMGREPRSGRALRALRGLLSALADRSLAEIVGLWLAIVVACAIIDWLAGSSAHGLREAADGALADGRVPFATALYFSFVTALSIGYGDVVPTGLLRALAVAEGAFGLLLFGVLISKLVSRRQEELTAEIHRITFEDRLGRVRTNLHLVLSELQALAEQCASREGVPDERIGRRIEIAVAVFVGELRAIHDLLFRPQRAPEEAALEALLAHLAAALGELAELLECIGDRPRPLDLARQVVAARALAREICGDCVPRAYAAALRGWMDRIQELSTRLR